MCRACTDSAIPLLSNSSMSSTFCENNFHVAHTMTVYGNDFEPV